jgi:hypothetical protein
VRSHAQRLPWAVAVGKRAMGGFGIER